MDTLQRFGRAVWILPLVALLSCGSDPAAPGDPAPSDIPGPTDGIPAPTIVGYQEFYGSFGPSTYFLFGYRCAAGAPAILQELLDAGLVVKRAWFPHGDGGCMQMLLAQMIVEMHAPDERMLEHGFTTDCQPLAPGPCIPTWLQYSFENQGD